MATELALASDFNQAEIEVAQADEAQVLTEIYQANVNMAVWQRDLTATLQEGLKELLALPNKLKIVKQVSPETVLFELYEVFKDLACCAQLSEDIAQLVDMFSCLFDLKTAGLRLAVLDSAMCPKFHFDRIHCRLVTTYSGTGTQWLAHSAVDYSKLGARSAGKSDAQSGVYAAQSDIQQLRAGDVALLKGSLWPGNEEAGLIHRSPQVKPGERRVVLTLDCM